MISQYLREQNALSLAFLRMLMNTGDQQSPTSIPPRELPQHVLLARAVIDTTSGTLIPVRLANIGDHPQKIKKGKAVAVC